MWLQKFILLILISFPSACAVNRVINVKSQNDTITFYKTPVVYGIGTTDRYIKTGSYDNIEFLSYDPETKQGAGSCLGAADRMTIGVRNPERISHYLFMAPTGYYAYSPIGIKPYEANPSVYFEIKKGHPQYLGDFIIDSMPSSDSLTGHETLALPVNYNEEKARKTLEKYGIDGTNMEKVELKKTDGFAHFFICTP